MFGLGGIDLLRCCCFIAAAAAVDYCCCCCRASTGFATANTYTTRCCEQVRHAAAVQYGAGEGGGFLKRAALLSKC